ncbi:MFS transporter [Cellulomonas sp.]|uniref:MFS transporter n=1 Tax=Cellulomonas sp. TaxID=40001 RepID=UPI001B121019|nr:MFS transporter [Cellulomonas sp.]MBO9556199.1 MFS transporter [Cellulomonas sp.]
MTAATHSAPPEAVRSLIPARLDRLPWTRFHWMVVVGLGVSWILDGLEIQLVANVGSVLTEPASGLGIAPAEVGLLASVYLVGQVVGALVFGRLTDRLGRRRLFILTLVIYLVGSGLGGLSWNLGSFLVFRFVAGMGIGGEYTAINSAIDELIPAHFRGRVDIAVNGTYWAGALIGSLGALVLLNPDLVPIFWGWRICFFIGPVLGLVIIYIRRHIPESPRWQLTHGYAQEAEATIDGIEETVRAQGGELSTVDDSKAIEVVPERSIPILRVGKIMFTEYRRRAVLGGTMMITQSFLYNAIFFSYALVLTNFFDVPSGRVPLYFIPFALGNLLGPLCLGHLFDVWGRRRMILLTYGLAAGVLALAAVLFNAGALTAVTQTILWCVCFFFASAGASSAYLTVSEIFPLELRGQAIAFFFCIAQLSGAVAAALYAALVGEGDSRGPLAAGYALGAAFMLAGGLVAWFIGVDAERRSLEDIADPLTSTRRRGAVRATGASDNIR